MKKMFIGLAAVIALLFLSTPVLFAQDPTATAEQRQACNDPKLQNSSFCKSVQSERDAGDRILGPSGIITRIAQLVVYLTGVISVIMVIIGGFRYVVSGGDSSGISGAKNTIMYALVGLVVAIFAQAIVTFVLSKL